MAAPVVMLPLQMGKPYEHYTVTQVQVYCDPAL